MKKPVVIVLFLFVSVSAIAQDYIKTAVVQCCECFSNGNSENRDSLMISCTILAISQNFDGLVSDLNLYNLKTESARKVMTDRMIKHFRRCKPIKKYFKEMNKNHRRSKD